MAHSPLDPTSSSPTGPAPLVSVVICYLNGANFIEEAIGSVLAQDCSDWELVLVNDGSSDESPAIAARHAANDPRIRTLSHPDGRNHGLPPRANWAWTRRGGVISCFLTTTTCFALGHCHG
ncbi:glycosyltransferase [Novosphingobium olei]|uniref:glycosyltransferase family 2 protein n=1 Tax=Novosphingobium olei TaxID=2728851 RepID=UPI003086DDE3|nr:hypothetical protein NSDW_19870 [Novosphingobium olei]